MQILLGGKRSIHHIRGHFLLSAVLCFIRNELKRIVGKYVNVSNEAFFAMLVEPCKARIEKDFLLIELKEKSLIAAEQLTNLLSQKVR